MYIYSHVFNFITCGEYEEFEEGIWERIFGYLQISSTKPAEPAASTDTYMSWMPILTGSSDQQQRQRFPPHFLGQRFAAFLFN